MLPWQQWRAKGCPPANQNSRSYRCCTTSGRSRSGNKPTVPGLGFNITALQSTLPPAGPVSCCCSTLSLKVGLALPWANHKQRGRLCAVSVTKSSSSAPLLLVGSCCCSGTATGNPSCDWLSCSYLLTCCLLRLTSLCSFHVTKDWIKNKILVLKIIIIFFFRLRPEVKMSEHLEHGDDANVLPPQLEVEPPREEDGHCPLPFRWGTAGEQRHKNRDSVQPGRMLLWNNIKKKT